MCWVIQSRCYQCSFSLHFKLFLNFVNSWMNINLFITRHIYCSLVNELFTEHNVVFHMWVIVQFIIHYSEITTAESCESILIKYIVWKGRNSYNLERMRLSDTSGYCFINFVHCLNEIISCLNSAVYDFTVFFIHAWYHSMCQIPDHEILFHLLIKYVNGLIFILFDYFFYEKKKFSFWFLHFVE